MVLSTCHVEADLESKLQRALVLEKGVSRNVRPLASSYVTIPTAPDATKWRKAGMEQIKNRKIAVVTLAGGQGTRLGSKLPKGCFEIANKSLFKMQAERIEQLDRDMLWCVMTSPPTHRETVKHFEENNYFGLTNIRFFEQGLLPALNELGGVIKDQEGRPVLSPSGNGGFFAALKNSGVCTAMEQMGIAGVHIVSVDNVLVKPADPMFIGWCFEFGLDVGVKSVVKSSPSEKTGVFALNSDDKIIVTEYTELPKAQAQDFIEANIANHFFSLKFIETVPGDELPFHVARKDIRLGPELKVPGIKLEQFIFDAFVYSRKTRIMRVERSEEFAPLKNADGDDSPASCLNALRENKYV